MAGDGLRLRTVRRFAMIAQFCSNRLWARYYQTQTQRDHDWIRAEIEKETV